MGKSLQRLKDEAIANFRYEGILVDERPYGSGHINDTFLLTFDICGMGRLRVILQRMNTSIYIRPIFGNKQRFMRKLLVKFFQFLFKSAQITTIPSIIKIKSQ